MTASQSVRSRTLIEIFQTFLVAQNLSRSIRKRRVDVSLAVPVGQSVEGKNRVAASQFGQCLSGNRGVRIRCVAPVVAGAEELEEPAIGMAMIDFARGEIGA